MPTKQELRADFAARRAQMSSQDRVLAAAQLVTHLASNPLRLGERATVACYVPMDPEPGSMEFLDELRALGCPVIVPVVPAGAPQPLDWVRYESAASLTRGRFGLLEPNGTPLGVRAIDMADVIFVPALALARTGIRLGRGAGYYDRTIGGSDRELVGIVYDHELVDDLPGDSYDVPMRWALTPGRGFIRLG